MSFQKNLEYKRLYILQPEYYQKLNDVYNKHQQLQTTEFDKDIFNILSDNTLSNTQKYYSYLKRLSKKTSQLKQLNSKLQHSDVTDDQKMNDSKHLEMKHTHSNEFDYPNMEKLITDVFKKETAALLEQKPHVKTSKNVVTTDTQVSPKKFRNKGVQVEDKQVETKQVESIPKQVGNIPTLAPESLYEYIPQQEEQPVPNMDTGELSIPVNDHFLEAKLHYYAQKISNEPRAQNIVVEKNSINENFRAFHNIENNDSIAIEVKPVFESMYGNKQKINWDVSEERKPLNGRFILAQETREKTNSKHKTPAVAENLLEKTLLDLAFENTPIETTLEDLVLDTESIDKDFRIFDNTRTGDRIAIETRPVIDNLLNKTDEFEFDLEVKDNKKDKRGQFILLRSRSIKRPSAQSSKSVKKKRKKSNQRSSSKQRVKG